MGDFHIAAQPVSGLIATLQNLDEETLNSLSNDQLVILLEQINAMLAGDISEESKIFLESKKQLVEDALSKGGENTNNDTAGGDSSGESQQTLGTGSRVVNRELAVALAQRQQENNLAGLVAALVEQLQNLAQNKSSEGESVAVVSEINLNNQEPPNELVEAYYDSKNNKNDTVFVASPGSATASVTENGVEPPRPPQTPLSNMSEGSNKILFSDNDASVQYVLLQQHGLNVLRSEIIAAQEFIPVTGKTELEKKNFEKRFRQEDGKSITVTSVSRLIELHRQIRSYVILAAERVIERSFPRVYSRLTSDNILSTVKRLVESHFRSYAENNQPDSVNFQFIQTLDKLSDTGNEEDMRLVFNNVLNSLRGYPQLKQAVKQTVLKSGKTNVVDMTAVLVLIDNLKSGSTNPLISAIVKSTVLQNQFLIAIFSYFIYERLISVFAVYVNRIANVDKIFELSFGLDTTTFRSSLYDGGDRDLFDANTINAQSNPVATKNTLGIVRTQNCTDGSIATAANFHLASLMMFFDSNYALSQLNTADPEVLNVNPSFIKTMVSGDMLYHMNRLRRLRVTDLVSEIPIENIELRLANSKTTTSTVLTPREFYKILNFVANPNLGSTDFANKVVELPSLATQEALAMLAQDYAICSIPKSNGVYPIKIYAVHEGLRNRLTDPATANFDSNVRNMYELLVTTGILGIEAPTSGTPYAPISNGIPQMYFPINSYNSVRQYPSILLRGYDPNHWRQLIGGLNNPPPKLVVPFESKYNTSFYGVDYTTGFNYFKSLKNDHITKEFNIASAGSADADEKMLLAGSISAESKNPQLHLFEHLSGIFSSYSKAENASNYGDNYSPAGKLSGKHRIVSLMQSLVEDLKKLQADTSRIPLLAVFLNQGTEESKSQLQLNTFLSFFWNFVLSHDYRKNTYRSKNFNTSAGQNFGIAPGVNTSVISAQDEQSIHLKHKSVATTLAMDYTERCVLNFLQNAAGATTHSVKVKPIGIGTSGISHDAILNRNLNLAFNDDPAVLSLNPGATLLGPHKDVSKINMHAANITSANSVDVQPSEIIGLFNAAFGGGQGSLTDVFSTNVDPNVSSKNFGMFRLFEEFFTAATLDLDFNNDQSDSRGLLGRHLELDNEGHTDRNNIFFGGNEASFGHGNVEDNGASVFPKSLGQEGPLSLLAHQKSILVYKWLKAFILDSLNVDVMSTGDGRLMIRIFNQQIAGLIYGLSTAIANVDDINAINTDAFLSTSAPNEEFQRAFLKGFNTVKHLFSLVDVRRRHISNTLTAFKNLTDGVSNFYATGPQNGFVTQVKPRSAPEAIAVKDFFEGEDAQRNFNLLLTSNSLTAGTMLASFSRKYDALNTLVPTGYRFYKNKNRLMHKVFSKPGFGFLESEKRGLKTILNVGLTSGMLDIMQKKSYTETGNPAFLNSPYVAIEINKINHLQTEAIYCPKIFVFNANAHILDSSLGREQLTNHLKNYTDNANFDEILKSIEYNIFGNDPQTGLDLRLNTYVGPQPKLSMIKTILENHLIDYLLKEYMQLTSGLDLNEETFLLGEPKYRLFKSQGKHQEIFQEVVNTMSTVYPQVTTDDQLRNEVFRLTNVIKEVFPFGSESRYVTCTNPKKFDRVFSIFVNEKDFILKSFPDIFTKDMTRNIGSRLERPERIDFTKLNQAIARSLQAEAQGNTPASSTQQSQSNSNQIQSTLGEIYKRSTTTFSSQLLHYADSLNNNAPEMYNYSVSITLLPSDFLNPQGKKEEKATQEPDKPATQLQGLAVLPGNQT